MYPQVVIIVYERSLFSTGGPWRFKNGHPNVGIRIVDIVLIWAIQPCNSLKIPAVFWINIQGGEEVFLEFFVKCIIKGREKDPWYSVNRQVILDQCELVGQRHVSYHDDTSDFQKLYVVGMWHEPLLPTCDIFIAGVTYTNRSWGEWHGGLLAKGRQLSRSQPSGTPRWRMGNVSKGMETWTNRRAPEVV